MTNKDRTIQACKDLAEKYKKPQGLRFFANDSCELCTIHYDNLRVGDTCSGCPLARKNGSMGCLEFPSYEVAVQVAIKIEPGNSKLFSDFPEKAETPKEFLMRAAFFKKIIPILKKMPSKLFTRTGWRYFKEIKRDW